MTEKLVGAPRADQLGDATTMPFHSSEYTIAVAQLDRYGDAIGKEFTLVSDRMTWMVVAESFIFSAFATSAAYYTTSGAMKCLVGFLLILMPLLGVFLATIVIFAITAAHEAIVLLKTERESFESRLPKHLRIRTISCRDPQHNRGNLPARLVPAVIIAFWLVLVAVVLLSLYKVYKA